MYFGSGGTVGQASHKAWWANGGGSHTNPLAQLYFEERCGASGVSRVRDGVRDDNVLWATVMSGAFVLLRWALDINTASDRSAIDAMFYGITEPLLKAVPGEKVNEQPLRQLASQAATGSASSLPTVTAWWLPRRVGEAPPL